MFNFFDPPTPKPLIPEAKIDSEYKKMRIKVFLGAFLGYAGYYLVRKNLALASPGMIQSVENGGLGYTKAELGIAMSALSIAYAFSKFIMGSISDRSDARKFLVVGLILSSIIMMSVGIFPFATSSIPVIFMFMFLIGWLSGMGWPPCGRIMVHWFSQNERSMKMSIWNTSHTVGSGMLGNLAAVGTMLLGGLFIVDIGGGIMVEQTWRSVFVFPAIVALAIAVFCWWALRDTPQSCGLPPIDKYRNDLTAKVDANGGEKIPFSKLFVDYIFKNRVLWIIAIANAFVYLVRYGIGDWSATYLQETGILNSEQSKMAFALHNYAGVPGTILGGIISAKFFKGRCAPANVIYMVLVLVSILFYWQATPIAEFLSGTFGFDFVSARVAVVYSSLIAVGFFIYGPVALIGVQAVNLVPKNAAGTAAGFVGLFGYLIGDALLSKIVVGAVASNESLGWNATFWLMIAASIIAAVFSAATWKREKEACIVQGR
jgi:OPA family glycerol-3-phosphate transporter-like MFS transporter